MKLLIYLLGIIGSVGSLVYSFNFSSNNHFIFISCIIVGLLIKRSLLSGVLLLMESYY